MHIENSYFTIRSLAQAESESESAPSSSNRVDEGWDDAPMIPDSPGISFESWRRARSWGAED